MPNLQEESDYTCDHCKSPVNKDDTYCTKCGALFSDDMFCVNHRAIRAEGVCVICSRPFCKQCGEETMGVFFCDPDSQYEFQEGMARIYGSIDNLQAQYVTDRLKQAGFHPFFFSRGFNPGPGMLAEWRLATIRNFGNHPIVEMKVMVPFSEVRKAEQALIELGVNPA